MKPPEGKRATDTARSSARAAKAIALLVLTAVSVEATCQVYFRARRGRWIFQVPPPLHEGLFERHPYLVGVGRPRVGRTRGNVTITHNAYGWRGPELVAVKPPGVTRVLAIGGSSTYGVGVSDHDTWPYLLGNELGPAYEVINLGVPGYSTVENLIQTAFWASDLSPDVAIYLVGWNDLQSMFVKDLKPDYSDFHAPNQIINLALSPLQKRRLLAAPYYVETWLWPGDLAVTPTGNADKLSGKIDPRALELYRRNLGTIVAITRALGLRTILVPQVLNDAALTADEPYGWVPFVKDRDLAHAMADYNAAMRDVAATTSTEFLGQLLAERFTRADFVDFGHFSAQGNAKLAQLLARTIRGESSSR